MKSLKILLVEDLASDAEIALRELKRAGLAYESRRVETEEDLRRECAAFVPDIVLSDFALPRFDGVAALRCVRDLMPDVPFIFVSGTIGEETAVKSLRAGATDYVLKTNLSRLAAAVQRAALEADERAARHAAEQRTKSSERVLRSFMENLPGLAYTQDADGRITYVNRTAEWVLGQTADELVGVNPADLLWSPALQALVAGDAEVRNARAALHTIRTLPTPSGDRQWMVVKFPLRNDDEWGGIGGIAMDLTERLQTEETLRLRDRAVEASMNPVLIASATDAGMPLVYVNRAFERVTGWGRDEVIGRNARLLHGEDRDQPGLDKIRRAIAEKRDGQAVLRNYRKDGSLFWNQLHITPVHDPRSGLVTHFVGVQHDITEIKRYQDELEHQANHDALTGLANRNLLRDRVQQALALAHRSGRKFTVVLIDLDNFKLINDSLGHALGDDVLKILAERMSGCIREGDTVARPGGDEFVLVAVEQDQESDIHRVVHRVMTAIAQPFTIGVREFKVTCSVGIAMFPDDGADADTLLRNADAAMYEAKGLGRNTFRHYSPEMNSHIGERLMLEAELWRALERDELLLHYQPKVHLPTGRIVGVEALIRWNHPRHGMVPPSVFVPVAEESGLILEVGRWVIATACAQCVAWRQAGLPPIPIAVNMSARQLHDPDIVNTVRSVLDMTGLEADQLEIEITESAAMLNADEAIHLMMRLREMGVRISLDDFGTGYSSLSYLKRLPVTGLKIDQSFIREFEHDAGDAAIVRAVIAVASALSLDVTAEGVETAAQVRFLNAYGCREAQGYYFARPVPVDVARTLLERGILPIG